MEINTDAFEPVPPGQMFFTPCPECGHSPENVHPALTAVENRDAIHTTYKCEVGHTWSHTWPRGGDAE